MMEVFYRLYPGTEKSNQERPFFAGDKLALAYVCLLSFVESCAWAGRKPKLTFLFDTCPDQWIEMVREVVSLWDFDDVTFIPLQDCGNQPSFRYQLDLALSSTRDVIYFAEDDYLYVPEAIREIYRFANQSDQFWSPYDHPDRYTRTDDRGDGRTEVQIVAEWRKLADDTWECEGRHWRRVESVCMTFGGERELFAKNKDLLHDHACTGRYLWYPILDEGSELWSPIPALATHVRNGYMSMCVDWREVLRNALNTGLGYSPSMWLSLGELTGYLMKRLEEWR